MEGKNEERWKGDAVTCVEENIKTKGIMQTGVGVANLVFIWFFLTLQFYISPDLYTAALYHYRLVYYCFKCTRLIYYYFVLFWNYILLFYIFLDLYTMVSYRSRLKYHSFRSFQTSLPVFIITNFHTFFHSRNPEMAGQFGGVSGHLLRLLHDTDEGSAIPPENPAGVPRLDV